MIDYKISNNNRFRYFFIIIEIFSEITWCIPLKMKNSETITKDFSRSLFKSKENLLKEKAIEEVNFILLYFKIFWKVKIYTITLDSQKRSLNSRIKTIRNFLNKPVFKKGNADWLGELPSVMKKFKNTIHSSTKITPIQISKN